jgi:hypothetical protein
VIRSTEACWRCTQGVLKSAKGEQRVILKRVKDKVEVRPKAALAARWSLLKDQYAFPAREGSAWVRG